METTAPVRLSVKRNSREAGRRWRELRRRGQGSGSIWSVMEVVDDSDGEGCQESSHGTAPTKIDDEGVESSV